MSKAEERAFKEYPVFMTTLIPAHDDLPLIEQDCNKFTREAYIKGYLQAEKDNELTWEDINRIEIIIKDVYRDYPHGIEAKQFGIEVLNRFNKQKGANT